MFQLFKSFYQLRISCATVFFQLKEDNPCARNVKKAVLNDLSARNSNQDNDLAVASVLAQDSRGYHF